MLPTARQHVHAAAGGLVRLTLRSLQVAALIVVVVVPFAYAVTGVHRNVLLGTGCGLAVGVGLGLRIREPVGRSVGMLVGVVAGMAAALLAGLVPGYGVIWIVPPLVALAVGLVDGFGTSRLQGYRNAIAETAAMASLVGAGLLPSLGIFWSFSCILVMPPTALVAGALSAGSVGRRPARPPVPLLLATVFVLAFVVDRMMRERVAYDGVPQAEALLHAVVTVPLAMVAIPIAVFLAARAGAVWLRPRVWVYRQLAEYLRVMWIPIGAFAIGYLAIIIVFAGFSGMLARFSPAAFTGADGAGIGDWVAFAFFRALGQAYPGIVPASSAAWLLAGVQAVVTLGWALVVFAAVMSSIQPRLERIARQALRAEDD